jgi:hypothetical protein
VLERSLGHEERAGQVDGDHLLPVLVGHLGHGPVDGDPGVVDQDVEAAMLIDNLAQDAPAVTGRADIPLVHGDPLPRVLGGHAGHELLRGLVVAPVAGRYLRARIGQLAADGGTDAAGAAGDQRTRPSTRPGRVPRGCSCLSQ